MLQFKFVLNTFLHDVLDDRSPARHLVSLLCNTFLTWYLVYLLSIALERNCHESNVKLSADESLRELQDLDYNSAIQDLCHQE